MAKERWRPARPVCPFCREGEVAPGATFCSRACFRAFVEARRVAYGPERRERAPSERFTLTADERLRVEHAISRLPAGAQMERLEALLKIADGTSVEIVAQETRASAATLYNWMRRFREGGIDGVADRPRPGRAKRLGPEDVQVIKKEMLRLGERWTDFDLRTFLKMQFGVSFTDRHFRKLAREWHRQAFGAERPLTQWWAQEDRR